MSVSTTLKTLIPRNWRQNLRELQFGLSLTHLRGPKVIEPAPNEAVVTCLVKNGEFYLEQFIEHYFNLGFKHICFLDNGSTDNTVERALRHRNVTVYRCTLPVSAHQGLLKKQFAERTVRAGWCLDVDVDEFFDYPYSDVVPLPRFLEYLNDSGYGAVITQMLDMFSDNPLSSLAQRQQENLKQVHRYYDISQVTKTSYLQDPLTTAHGPKNLVTSPEAAVYWGGIRMTVWGLKCLLTKHSLFRTGAGLQLFPHVHYVNGAKLADVSGALLHYKFASNANDEAGQNKAAFAATSGNYKKIMEAIASRPDFRIKSDSAREFRGATDLLESGFLFASEDYRSYARNLTVLAGRTASQHADMVTA